MKNSTNNKGNQKNIGISIGNKVINNLGLGEDQKKELIKAFNERFDELFNIACALSEKQDKHYEAIMEAVSTNYVQLLMQAKENYQALSSVQVKLDSIQEAIKSCMSSCKNDAEIDNKLSAFTKECCSQINDIVSKAFTDEKRSRLENLIGRLDKEIKEKHYDRSIIEEICNNVLNNIDSKNIVADFCFVIVKNDSDYNKIISHLRALDITKVNKDFGRYIDFAIRNMTYGSTVKPMIELIKKYYNQFNLDDTCVLDDEQLCLYDKLEKKEDEIRRRIRNPNRPRNIFVAYAGEEVDEAYKLVHRIEEETYFRGEKKNFTCFLADRNLQESDGHYKTDIPTALKQCEIFLLVSSPASRSNENVREEVESWLQGKNALKRCEWRLDDKPKRSIPEEEQEIENAFSQSGKSSYFLAQEDDAFNKLMSELNGFMYSHQTDDGSTPKQNAPENSAWDKQQDATFGKAETDSSKQFKYCLSCGAKNDYDSKFCKECGKTAFGDTYDYYLKERERREAMKPYKRVNDYGEEDKSGKYILFGSYPQSKVTDSALIQKLADLAYKGKKANLPTAASSNGWTDYGYYIEGEKTSFMWYKDVNCDGEKYRAVYFTSYRPYFTSYSSSTSETFQNDNGYSKRNVYWFRFESVKWRILSEKGGTAMLLAEMIIDSQEYDKDQNNYQSSSIRAWLNESFYKTAFSDSEKALIQTTTVDNSALSTASDGTTSYTNSYACSNTNDKVFLLSQEEVTTTSYGFATYTTNDTARQKKTTDYAQCQGAYTYSTTGYSYTGCGYWWLRSPPINNSLYARNVYSYGNAFNHSDVYCTHRGVVPALNIQL